MQRVFAIALGMVRTALVLVLVAGVLAPRVSAVLVDILPGFQKVVICTGAGMQVWILDQDGKPVETVELDDDRCLAADGRVLTDAGDAFWHILARDYAFRFSVLQVAFPESADTTTADLIRGPPVFA